MTSFFIQTKLLLLKTHQDMDKDYQERIQERSKNIAAPVPQKRLFTMSRQGLGPLPSVKLNGKC